MVEQAVILAGGLGTRMKDVTPTAKCLLKIRGKSILEWQVKFFSAHGVSKFLLLLGYAAHDVLLEAAVIAERYGVNIEVEIEDQPLGTGGALLHALPRTNEIFFLTHGDLILDTQLRGLIEAIKSADFDVSLLYHPTNHPDDSDLIQVQNHDTVVKIVTKPHNEYLGRSLGNAGVYAFRRSALLEYSRSLEVGFGRYDLDRQLLPKLLANQARIAAIRNVGFVKDVGTPERYDYVESNWESLMDVPGRRPAIFLDRDGTLNELQGFITTPQQIKLVKDAAQVVAEFRRLGFWVLVITNQPVIARGEVSVEGLDEIHGKVERGLLNCGTIVDDFFYCPHHPEAGFEGEVPELKIACKCRKPEVGLIEKAKTIYPIDMSKSWMIGDSWRDAQLARAVGIRSILLSEDGDGKVSADFYAKTLTRALEIVREQV
jgi:mannose-1-phosphate guanylyltransferase/phosphomannomutase